MKKLCSLFFGLAVLGLHAQKKWSLRECVVYAMKNNLQVIQSDFNRQLQEKNLDIAKRDYLPSVSATLSNSANFGQSQDVFGTIRRNDNFNNNTGIGANILVFNNGRLEKTVRKTEFDVEASVYDTETVKNNIALQIAQQYLNVLLNREIAAIAKSAADNAEQLFRRAKITTEAGTTPLTSQYEAQATWARERLNLQKAEINTERSLFALAQLLRLPDYRDFDVEDVVIDELPDQPLSHEAAIEAAYETQPQIKAATARIRAAEQQIKVTETLFWPTVTANAGFGSFYFKSLAYGGDQPFYNQYKDNFSQQLGLNANIPIFNKGITRLQVEQSKIAEAQQRVGLESEKQQLRENVQLALFDANANYEAYRTALEAEESSRLALDFAEKSYAAGRSTVYDLDLARNNLVNAQSSVAQAKYNYLFSVKLLNFYQGIPLSL
ncbi:MAG: TolC family protein [Chryseobacterium sp.]|nr:MAG: TolC family protein [Chryseobacterium sp.]